MPFHPKSSIPRLLEQIFSRNSKSLENDRRNNICADESRRELFFELEEIFGDLLRHAVRILDEQKLTLYTTNKGLCEIAEITDHTHTVFKLFSDVNYCQCTHFCDNVLQIQSNTLLSLTNSKIPKAEGVRYTCQHVLAIRLAKLLQNTCVHRKVLSDHEFNYLIKQLKNTINTPSGSSVLKSKADQNLHISRSKTPNQRGISKNMKMLTNSQYIKYKFYASLDSIKSFYAGIKALYFGETGFFQISNDGLCVNTESGKSIQASLFMTTSCFDEYHVDGLVCFGLNINVIIECLSAFSGIDCGLKFLYKDDGSPLILVLELVESDNTTTECSIKTTFYCEPFDFNLNRDSTNLNTVFVRGPDLASIFQDLDKSAAEVAVTLSPQYFKIATLGVMQSEASFQVSKTSDIILFFNCSKLITARYKNSHVRLISRSLAVANKVAIKTDSNGLLEFQFMLQSEDDSEIYIQFYLTPVVEND